MRKTTPSAPLSSADCRAQVKEILRFLAAHANQKNVAGMARFGIKPGKAFGLSAPLIHAKARELGRNHERALLLWDTGVHEARVLATLTAEPERMTQAQAEMMVRDFDNWAVCDCACMYLLDKTAFARKLVKKWVRRDEEYVRRAGFVLMAVLAVHDKHAPDSEFENYLPLIGKYAFDERNFVRKAVNWALRQIGKRNPALNKKARAAALEIRAQNSKSARWIAADALRELEKHRFARRTAPERRAAPIRPTGRRIP